MSANFKSELDENGHRVLVAAPKRRPVILPSQPRAEKAAPPDPILKKPGGPSIKAAGDALHAMFGGLMSGENLDLAPIEKASEQVIDAVEELGLAKWLSTVRSHHKGTFQHCLIVTGVATSFGTRNRMRREDIAKLTVAGLMHDIGKAKIPLAILDKPGRLDPEETAIMQRHPVIGYDYLRSQNLFPEETLAMVRHHHEYLDGSGYPDGIAGAEINDVTRILTICDIYGALIEARAYKAPKSPEEAKEILLGMAKQGKVEECLVGAL